MISYESGHLFLEAPENYKDLKNVYYNSLGNKLIIDENRKMELFTALKQELNPDKTQVNKTI